MISEIPTQSSSYTKKIVKNTLYNVLGNFTLISIGFVLIPYIIKHVGAETYGNVWVVAIIIISSSQLIDFGLGSACIKYISEFVTRNDTSNVNRVISTTFFFYLIFWILIFIFLSLFGQKIVILLGTDLKYYDDMYFVLLLTFGIVAINHISTPFYASVSAIQRYDLLNLFHVLGSIINFTLAVILFESGIGIRGLAISYFVFYLFIAISVTIITLKYLPFVKLRLKDTKYETLKKVFSFGGSLQISRIAQIFVFQLDKFIALRFFGGLNATFYEIGAKLSALTRNIPLLLTSAILPAASELDARQEDKKIYFLFESGTRYLFILGLILGGFFFTHSELLVQAWIGKKLQMEGINISATVIRLLIIGYFFNMATGFASTIAAGLNRTDIEKRTGILMLVSFPIITFIAVLIYGYFGVAIAVSITLMLCALYYTKQFLKIIKYNLNTIFKLAYKPIVATIISSGVTILIEYYLPRSFVDTRIGAITSIILLFVIFSLVFILIVYLVKGFAEIDRNIFLLFVKKYGRESEKNN